MQADEELLPITIVVTTYAPPGEVGIQRRNAAMQAWESWRENLKYDGELRVHIADDGSELVDYTESWWKQTNRRYPLCEVGKLTYSRQNRWGVGASLNAGLRAAHQNSPLTLYAVDDWKLVDPINLTPWAKLLHAHEDLGALRLGPPHPWLTGQVEHDDGRWYLRIDRHHYAFSFRPTLFHQRLFDAYGQLPEDVTSLESEKQYNEAFCAADGPDIALALLTPYDHIYTTELSAVQPDGRTA